jgi:hypothetical protein
LDDLRKACGKKTMFSPEEQKLRDQIRAYQAHLAKQADTFDKILPATARPYLSCKWSWDDFIPKEVRLQQSLQKSLWRNSFFFYPNLDAVAYTPSNVINYQGKYLSHEGEAKVKFSLVWDLTKKFLAMILYDVMMWDFDDKDMDLSWEDLRYVLGLFTKQGWCFVFFKTDRGKHVFGVNHQRIGAHDLHVIDFMGRMCNDTNYTAFVYQRGWAIRLNGKSSELKEKQHVKDTKTEDFVAKPELHKGTKLPLYAFESMTRKMLHLPAKVELQYFTPATLATDSEFFLGDLKSVDMRKVQMVLFHYFLIQVFRVVSGVYADAVQAAVETRPYSKQHLVIAIRHDMNNLLLLSRQLLA